jgi:Undecaprenyl-phosphate glucose phosphotransferase
MARGLLQFALAPNSPPGLRHMRSGSISTGKPWRLGPIGFAYLAALADAIAVLGAAATTALVRVALFDGSLRGLKTGLDVGLIVAVLVIIAELHNGGYTPTKYEDKSGQFARAFPLWNLTALAALALGVAARVVGDYPRGGLALFYVLGLAGLVWTRRALAGGLATMHARGAVAKRRVALIGFEHEIEGLKEPELIDSNGAEIVCQFALRETEAFFHEDLALAVAAIRLSRAEDVFVALPLSRGDLIEACLAGLTKMPLSVHLSLGEPLRAIRRAEVERLGPFCGLTMTQRPLGRVQQIEKRAFDIVVSSLALLALAPLFAIVALLIRLEGPGPVIFKQKRYGLNQEPFQIFKFRTMRTMENGRVVTQATRGDPRVTRVGAHLRRLSIDELPQLLNVLIGDMSVVGPRPHALAHDQFYVEKLARYARRHNVKPGITGWAQVFGHRGEISNDSAMLARLEHDLYYVDNWSLWLDVKILFMTVFSRRAHANAY